MSQGRKLPALDSDSESGVVSLLQAGVSPEWRQKEKKERKVDHIKFVKQRTGCEFGSKRVIFKL